MILWADRNFACGSARFSRIACEAFPVVSRSGFCARLFLAQFTGVQLSFATRTVQVFCSFDIVGLTRLTTVPESARGRLWDKSLLGFLQEFFQKTRSARPSLLSA